MDEKTNVMRLLDQKHISYGHYSYESQGALSGAQVAALLNLDAGRVFKTLVAMGKSKTHYVFMIPVAEELDLKKAAASVGEKSMEMVKSKELLGLTGYVHGGCSPIGMKKRLRTTIHRTAKDYATIVFSAGKIGRQVELPLAGLEKMIPIETADLIVASGEPASFPAQSTHLI